MTRTQFTDARRNLQKQIISWISIVVIGLVALVAYLSLVYSSEAIRQSVSSYYNIYNFYDIEITSTLLMDEGNLAAIRAVPGVKCAEPVWMAGAKLLDMEMETTVTVQSLPEEISMPELMEGRLPEQAGECAIEQQLQKTRQLGIGDKVRISCSAVAGIDPLEKTEYVVTGVIQDFKNNIVPQVDALLNVESSYGADQEKGFNSIGNYATLCRVRADVDRAEFDAKIHDLIVKDYGPVWGEEKIKDWRTWRMDEIFWNNGDHNGRIKSGNKQMINLLTVVVLLLLLSAVFNYINLSFALGGKRAKEMATRRLLGEDRSGIIWKNIGESVAFTAVCFAVGLLLAYLLVPTINALLSTQDVTMPVDAEVKLNLFLTPGYVVVYILGILVLGALCGLIPAWAASRYEPIDVIKGTLRRKNRMVFSRVFIIAQNALAVFLIALAFVMEAQMKHMLERPTHSAVDNRFYIEYSAMTYDQMKLFKDKVEQLPFVTKAGVGRNIPGSINMSQNVELEDGSSFTLPVILCDTTYFDLLGLEVLEDFGHPRLRSIWLDETAFKGAGVSDSSTVFPRMFSINGAKADYIGGIVRDFPAGSAAVNEVKTLNAGVIVSRPEDLFYAHCLLIGTIGEEKDYEREILKAYDDYRLEQFGTIDSPWRSGFIRDLNRQQLDPVRRTMRLVELFTVLAVLISLLGLLAMSTYFAGENTKQIAIRKVLGSDVSKETWRSVRSYMVMVGIACAIGIPLAVWAARLYLQRFAYRIEGYGWVFVAAVVVAVAIAFATVLWQTLKAAKTNPAVELKKE